MVSGRVSSLWICVPRPFVDAPYFGEEFLSETRSGKGVAIPLGTRLVIPNDQQGKYINVSNGKRRTAFQPIEVKNKVYLFGGSTIFSGEVPDEYTIASRLQQLLNTKFADRFTVENYGSTSVTLAQQLERLRTLQLAPGDVVIFYDGVKMLRRQFTTDTPKDGSLERIVDSLRI